LKNSMLSLLAL